MRGEETNLKQSDTAGAEARYALYWAPAAGSELERLGAAWLGRDAESAGVVPRPPIVGFDPTSLDQITAEPRRYGLHGTMKPPFRLAAGRSLAELENEIGHFATARAPVVAPPLKIAQVDRFVALIPSVPTASIGALAQECVAHFDRFRAPLSPKELERRRASPLTPSQENNLQRWGYPYVAGDFRFHVTLTGSLEASIAAKLISELQLFFAPVLTEPLHLREIVLFTEPTPGAPFQLQRRFSLGG
jgi:putative phosphonate metabolism protein